MGMARPRDACFALIGFIFAACVVAVRAASASASAEQATGALTIPFVGGDLATPEGLHKALAPAWDSLVEERNNAGLVEPKMEGKPQAPMSQEETAFQYDRVQKGQVDSARLLLVFGMVPSASHVDNATRDLMLQEKDLAERKRQREEGEVVPEDNEIAEEEQSNLPAVLDPSLVYADGSTPLHMASTFGLAGSARTLLDAGATVNATSNSGVQPIHSAAIMGHADLVDVLVQARADVDAPHGFAGNTPLHFAAEMGHTAVARRLCELGANVEAEKKQGGTALHTTADTNNADVARVLLEDPCGADPEAILLGDTVPLYLAAGRGFSKVIDVLIEAGANPDRTLWPKRPKNKKERKRTKQPPAATSQALAEAANPANFLPGSDPSAPGWEKANGATALHNAAENGHVGGCLALLDGGARQLSTMEGVTPLIMSMQYKHPDVANALLDHGTPANVAVASPRDGQTALHIAAAYGYPTVIARLLRQGAPTNVRDLRGHLPADYSRGALVEWLLKGFQGRDPKLDHIVRRAVAEDSDVVDALSIEVDGVDAKVHEAYKKYARWRSQGKLQDEVARITRVLASGDSLAKEKRSMFYRNLAISSFVLAPSDAYVAGQAMLQGSEEAMHAGLAMMGVKVKTLEYVPQRVGANMGGPQRFDVLKINGEDAKEMVDGALASLVRTRDFDAFAESMKLVVVKVSTGADSVEAAATGTPGDDAAGVGEPDDADVDEHLEL